MSENKIFITKKEGKPARCEICHQSDMFNQLAGICYRCTTNALVSDQIGSAMAVLNQPQAAKEALGPHILVDGEEYVSVSWLQKQEKLNQDQNNKLANLVLVIGFPLIGLFLFWIDAPWFGILCVLAGIAVFFELKNRTSLTARIFQGAVCLFAFVLFLVYLLSWLGSIS